MTLFEKSPFTLTLILTIASFIFGCGSIKNSPKKTGTGDTRTENVEFYDNKTYLLTKTAADSSYGFTSENPVCVGGIKDENAIAPTYYYMNALQGPNGEKIKFFRYGSCCSFDTPNGIIGNGGLLDRYGIYWEDSDTLSLFINIYDEGNLFVPIGLKSKK